MKRTLLLALAASLSLVSVAAAQPKGDPQTKPVKVRVLTIEGGDDITGDVPTGELVPIGVRELAKSTSLLRIRRDFIDMILKSAEQL